MSGPSGGTPQVLGMRPVDLNILQLCFDCEILKLVYQMKSGETLKLHVVDQNEKITEIQATKKKSKLNREVSVLTVKGDSFLKFHGGVACCLLGEDVDLTETDCQKNSPNETLQQQGASCISATSQKSDETTQTDLNPKDTCIKFLQSSLSNERMQNVPADETETASGDKGPKRPTCGVSDTSKLMKLTSEKAAETKLKGHSKIASVLALLGDTVRKEARKRKRGQPKKIEKTMGKRGRPKKIEKTMGNLDSVICDVLETKKIEKTMGNLDSVICDVLEGESMKNDSNCSETSAQQVTTKKGRLVRKPLHLRDADNVLVEDENQDDEAVLKIEGWTPTISADSQEEWTPTISADSEEEWTPTISADSEVRPAAVKRARKKKGAEKSDSQTQGDEAVLNMEEWTPAISSDSEVRPAAVKRARKKKGAEKSNSQIQEDEVVSKMEKWTPTISADSEVRPAAVKRARKKKGPAAVKRARKKKGAENEKSTRQTNVDSDSDKRPKKSNKKLCLVCGKMVTNMFHHSQIHSGPIKCSMCDKTVTTHHNLRRHIAVVHDRKFSFHCDHCGKGYNWKRCLLEHIQCVHVGDSDQTIYFPRKYMCEYCSKAFKYTGALKSHIDTVHKKVRSHACDICDKKFSRRIHLDVHHRTHTGDKPYLCSFCGKGFADKGNMDVHIQSLHLNNKLPYKCDACGMKFRRKKFLNVHECEEHGHLVLETGNPTPQQRQASFQKKNKNSKTIVAKEEAIIHLPVQEADLLGNVELELERPVITVKQETMEQDMQHDDLKLAVEQLGVDVSKSYAEKRSSQTVVKTEVVVSSKSVCDEEIGVVHVVGKAVETGNTSHSLTVGEIDQTSLPIAQSAVSVWPDDTAADIRAEYITVSEAEQEMMVVGQQIQENVQQPFRILELEGDTQPYLVIDDGTLTMLQSISADSVVDIDVVETQNSVVSR